MGLCVRFDNYVWIGMMKMIDRDCHRDSDTSVEPVFLMRPHWGCLILKGPVGPQGRSSGTASGPFNVVSTLRVNYRAGLTPLLPRKIGLPCTLHLDTLNWNVAFWKALRGPQGMWVGSGSFSRKNSSAGWGHGHLDALEKIGWFGSSARDAQQHLLAQFLEKTVKLLLSS